MKVLVIGGGIGGFATALSLHAVGIDCEVFEQSRTIRELGVGMNLLPHAVKELAELGLLDALDRVAIRTSELIYSNRFGQQLWREPRGLDAGYDYPQFSIHRGKLQGVLYEATRARIGEDTIHTAHQLHDVAQDAYGVTATFTRRDGSDETVTARGDVLIAADGIHSAVRRLFYPDEGPPTWNGIMIWRGAVAYPPFLTGRSMLIAGGMRAKLVLYPIAHQTSTPGTNLLNWAVIAKLGDGSAPPPRREDWNRLGRLDELLPHVAGLFQLPSVEPVDVIRATGACYEYPMCDRDPLPHWSFGRVTLLGDAAHPMYPVGSNGASQAILDARCLAPLLAKTKDVVTALKAYEAARLSATAKIVLDNRAGGPERVIDVVEERAPDGFADLDEVASHAELEAIVKGYSKIAGFDQPQVNRSKEVGMFEASQPGASSPRRAADCLQRTLTLQQSTTNGRMHMLLENKNALIYGAAGGIGTAVARAFAREGAKLFLAGRTLTKLEALVQEISAAGGVAEAAQVDALDEQAVEKHIGQVAEKAGSIDILFNAIGMQDVQGIPLIEMSLEDFSRPITIATRTQFLTARAVARRMIRQGSGVIMTITAGPARRAVPSVGGFDVACAAIEGLWRTFAAELGPYGIRLVVVGSAGSPDTPDVQETLKLHARPTGKSLEQVLADSGSATLLGRLPRVAEIARAATLMASDYASAMTGVIANVTCGYIVD